MERWKDAYTVVRAASNDTKDRLAIIAPAISMTCRIVTILLLREGNEFLSFPVLEAEPRQKISGFGVVAG